MGVAADDELLDLPGVPPGLAARRVREYRAVEDGEPVERTHRRRLRKVTRVELVPSGPLRAVELDDNEERWVLDAGHRRWSTVQGRYGEAALTRATALARAGAVRLICPVDDGLHVGAPTAWKLTEEWQSRAGETKQQRATDRERVAGLAAAAARAVERLSPPLAAALRTAQPSNPTTVVLVHAAEDLVNGVVHDGPRAFSQAHYATTKVRDDVTDILRRTGVGEDVLCALGVRRSSRLGLAGPIGAAVAGRSVELQLLDGPVLLRADQPGLALMLSTRVPLVIVENLQAAEVLVDQVTDVAVIYTAGPPSDEALRLIAPLGEQSSQQLIVPDADLGGVRIAERVIGALPAGRVLDIGVHDHLVTTRWTSDGISTTGLQDARNGPAADLARACLARGYPVEQELATVRAVRTALSEAAVHRRAASSSPAAFEARSTPGCAIGSGRAELP